MKKVLMAVVMVMSGTLMAGERVILKDSKEMEVDLNVETVLCSSVGYRMPELKVNIKELDGWTILDHSNSALENTLTLPCMSAGYCNNIDPQSSILKILQGHSRKEKIVVSREISEFRTLNFTTEGNRNCIRVIKEKLQTVIAGVTFNHARVSKQDIFPDVYCNF